jgi:DNA polymerase/3'-5' exonuclease PolX
MDLKKYEKRMDGTYHLKKEYYAEKGEGGEEYAEKEKSGEEYYDMKDEMDAELWDERKALIRERNDVLAKMRREPSVALRNELHEVNEKLQVNGKKVGVETEKAYYAKRIVMKKGKTHVTRSGEEVRQHAEEVRKQVAPYAKHAVIAGSIRRKVENPTDVDIVVVPKKESEIGKIKDIVKHGATKVYQDGNYKLAVRKHGIKTEIVFAKPSEFGATLMYATGPAGSNIQHRLQAKHKGWKLSQYGLFNEQGKLLASSEKRIYNKLGLSYRSPEKRGLPR